MALCMFIIFYIHINTSNDNAIFYILDFFMCLVISMYPHMYVKTVFITLQAFNVQNHLGK